jgi:hypothetical protein
LKLLNFGRFWQRHPTFPAGSFGSP